MIIASIAAYPHSMRIVCIAVVLLVALICWLSNRYDDDP